MAKYVSIDIETSGIDPEKHQLLEFGAILEDTENPLSFMEIPKFSCIIGQGDITGTPRALTMNERILRILSQYWNTDTDGQEVMEKQFNIISKHDLVNNFLEWLLPLIESEDFPPDISLHYLTKFCFPFTVAGKNFSSFDAKFLDKMPNWEKLPIERRVIDPSVLYFDWKNDVRLPSLDECLKRAGIEKTVTHTALEDAWDVIQVLRKKY